MQRSSSAIGSSAGTATGSGSAASGGRGLAPDDRRHRGDDERRAGQRADAELLAQERPAEQDGDERVDVRVGRDLRDRHVLQQPGVGGEGHERARDHEVGEGEQRLGRGVGEVQVVRPRRWPGRRPAALRRRRPSASRSRRADRTACSGAARGTTRSPTSPRPRGRAGCRPPWPRRAGCRGAGAAARPQKPTATPASVPRWTRSPPTVERRSTSHSGTEAMSSAASPAGTSRSATVTRPLPPAGSSRPTRPAAARLRGATRTRCPRAARKREHGDAGDREARAGPQQRRDVLDHHADGDVGPAPQDVDDGERRPHPPRGRREGVAGAGC